MDLATIRVLVLTSHQLQYDRMSRPSVLSSLRWVSTAAVSQPINPYNLRSWEDLLSFGRCVLTQPTRGGKWHNLASLIKKRTVEPYNSDQENLSHRPKKSDAATLLANAVSAKIEDGNVRAAIRITCSEDKPAPNSDHIYSQLLDKHPAPPPGRSSVPDPQPTAAVQVTETEVLQAVRSFPVGS